MQKETKELEEAKARIDKLLGCAKGRERPRLTPEQREKIAMELTEEAGEELMKEFGLKD